MAIARGVIRGLIAGALMSVGVVSIAHAQQAIASPDEQAKIQALLKTITLQNDANAYRTAQEIAAFGPKAIPVLVEVLASDKSCTTQWVASGIIAAIDAKQAIVLSTLTSIARGECTAASPPEQMLKREAAMTLGRRVEGIPIVVELLKSSDVFVRQSGAFALHDLLEVIGNDPPFGLEATAEFVGTTKVAIVALKNVMKDSDEIVRCVAQEGLQRGGASKNREIASESKNALKGITVNCSR